MDSEKPSRQRRSVDERLAVLKAREGQILAERAALVARKKEEARKLDTRRKAILGAALMADARIHPGTLDFIHTLLDRAITREGDKAVITAFLANPNGEEQ